MDNKTAALRQRLIARIQRLRPDVLEHLDAIVAQLPVECGALSPLLDEHTTPIATPPLGVANSAQIFLSHDKILPTKAESKSGDKAPHAIDWPHAPLHRIGEAGTFMVTTGTLHKEHIFRGTTRLDMVQATLLKLAKQYGWQLEAWAIFSNHYHFIAHSAPQSGGLDRFLKHLHADTAREVNEIDRQDGRQVWHNYWDTQLTFEQSYLARLNYVHQNAVKHGLVRVANQYRWCSSAWFEATVTPAQVKTIYSFKINKLRVKDDFDVVI